ARSWTRWRAKPSARRVARRRREGEGRGERSGDRDDAPEPLAPVQGAPPDEVAARDRGGEEMGLPARFDCRRLLAHEREIVRLLADVDDVDAEVVATRNAVHRRGSHIAVMLCGLVSAEDD